MRWRLTSLPSNPDPDDPQAPGDPRWRAHLHRLADAQIGADGELAAAMRYFTHIGDVGRQTLAA